MDTDSPLLDVGGAVRHIRENKGISQGDIMRKTGIERSYISRIERGEIRYPRLSTIKKIAMALGVSVEELVHIACHLVCEIQHEKG